MAGIHEPFAAAIRQASRDALHQVNGPNDLLTLDRLANDVAISVSLYRADIADQAPARVSHDALRQLFRLLDDTDPPVGQIRARLRELPAPAIRWVERRAKGLRSPLAGDKENSAEFARRIAEVEAGTLVPQIRLLVSEGGQLVEGRSDDRQARMRFEPMIMGTVRGAAGKPPSGGRPKRHSVDDLVMNLALDWYRATDEMPVLKRGDMTGFPGLVHDVFQLLEIGGAEQALRRYGTQVRRASIAT